MFRTSRVFTSSFDWFTRLSVSFAIGQSDFNFTPLPLGFGNQFVIIIESIREAKTMVDSCKCYAHARVMLFDATLRSEIAYISDKSKLN